MWRQQEKAAGGDGLTELVDYYIRIENVTVQLELLRDTTIEKYRFNYNAAF
jgi:hypothetical protein